MNQLKLPKASNKAISWIENNHQAYESGRIKIIKGRIHKQNKNGRIYKLYYKEPGEPYGRMYAKEISDDEYDKIHTTLWNYQTYCTMGVAAFLSYRLNCSELSYADARKKHPIYYFCQKNANTCAKLLRDEKIHSKYAVFLPIELKSAEYFAHNGKLIIAAWVNYKGAGHVAILIGAGQVYNVGSKMGVMSIEEAFGKNKNIQYYQVV